MAKNIILREYMDMDVYWLSYNYILRLLLVLQQQPHYLEHP